MADKVLRCAVYTRKSTEDGLEQEFNSLDAQYEACSSYALSQKHEGWQLVEARYDDGGFSGGNMQRPGLQRLLGDIAAGEVDIILIYKIDRLTRSLADFARIVDVLDAAGASFVSITQSFNTTTSMGRLTLNMLLSFAQFEREVTGERIRDKIAASKRKGLWMGGPVPLGYDVVDRKLVVNEPEAALVRHIMERYLALPSVKALADELNAAGHRTKIQHRTSGPHRGGCAFNRGMLYHLLANRIYLGDTVHKGEAFPGEHPAIVEPDLWDAVQAKLGAAVTRKAVRTHARHVSLLTGRLRDGDGRPMTPSHAQREGRRYRYYVTRADLVGDKAAWRVRSEVLEDRVCARLADLFGDQTKLCDLAGNASAEVIRQVLRKADAIQAALRSGTAQERLRLIAALVEQVTLDGSTITILVGRTALARQIGLSANSKQQSGLVLQLTTPFERERAARGLRMVIGRNVPGPAPMLGGDPRLVRLLAEAHVVREAVLANPELPLGELAVSQGKCRKRMTRLLALSCLSPGIVEDILEGRQPKGLSAVSLLENDLPLAWSEQRAALGMAA